MNRKTFISYKYSEARNLRDRIIEKLGNASQYYKGETAESPDLTDLKTETIKKNLRDMIYDSSVTIVIVSPNMTQSRWIDWEIEYSLKEIPRGERISHSNGIIGVIMKVDGKYDWIATRGVNADGCSYVSYKEEKLYNIIKQNRYNNITDEKYCCKYCKTYDRMNGSYISLIQEDDFLKTPSKYIENAYEKSQLINKFEITKER